MYIIYKLIIENIIWKLSIKHTTHIYKTLSFRRKTSLDMHLTGIFRGYRSYSCSVCGCEIVLMHNLP